jgi:hypothetical protein
MWSPGYSYPYFGGQRDLQHRSAEVMELGCFLEYDGKPISRHRFAEPMSCCIGAFHCGVSYAYGRLFTI